jgi:hypothetical protein
MTPDIDQRHDAIPALRDRIERLPPRPIEIVRRSAVGGRLEDHRFNAMLDIAGSVV